MAQDALSTGLTRGQVRHRVDSERWQRVARGAYLIDDRVFTGMDPFGRARLSHAMRAVAAAGRNTEATVAFRSAAFVLGLPTIADPAESVVLAVPPGRWTGRRSGIHVRRLSLPEHHTVLMRVPVTTPARTWLDIACRSSLADALAVGDAGLRMAEFTTADLAAILAEAGGVPGRRRAERALSIVSGERESPLESASYSYFVENRLPLPRMQVPLADDLGFVGRVDFVWDDARVIGESDGKMKYGQQGEAYREKLREDRLRALGFTVVRWGFADLHTPRLALRLAGLLRP